MSEIKILVISDLHAIASSDERDDSHLYFEKDDSEWGNALISYIKDLDTEIDVLVCAGDIANKACKQSFSNGWSFVNKLKEELNIPELLCVPGNHDHQSRNGDDFSPKHQIQFCKPIFPLTCNNKNTHFWAWNWVHVESTSFNSILVNSSAYHGYQDELKHGRVALEVSDQISDFLMSPEINEKPFNIMLCHHHPEKMEHVDHDYDGEAMEGGPYLLKQIEDADVGPWFVIHGHKHFASISYAKSASSSPSTILSAGSVSAKLYPDVQERTSNQFYLVNIDINETVDLGRLIGKFNTYEWTIKRGWGHSRSNNLPASGGFGSTTTNPQIIKKIKDLLLADGPFLQGEELAPIHEMTTYVPPEQFKKLVRKLGEQGYEVQIEQNKIIELGEGS
jgi:Calcineurin-like phosphoesterase